VGGILGNQALVYFTDWRECLFAPLVSEKALLGQNFAVGIRFGQFVCILTSSPVQKAYSHNLNADWGCSRSMRVRKASGDKWG
jgi:hypothetical protein